MTYPPVSTLPHSLTARSRVLAWLALWHLSAQFAVGQVAPATGFDSRAGVAYLDVIAPSTDLNPELAPGPLVSGPLSQDELLQQLNETQRRLAEIEQAIQEADDKDAAAKRDADRKKAEAARQPKKWYEKIALRGYSQVRLNEAFPSSDSLARPHYVGDSSVSDNQNFLVRRARLVLYGDVHEHVYIYFQPDFAVTPPGSTDAIQFTQIRDLYADVYIDDDKVNRFRIGQSKVPYGWENLQSSQNRLPLDRNDGLNSEVRNERDLGVFYYWTPTEAQELFKEIMDEGLKGSGNYGVFGIGGFNGQGGSLRDQNDKLHIAARLAWPFRLSNGQIVELGIQGFSGEYVVLSAPISPLGVGPPTRPLGTLEGSPGDDGIQDNRVAWTFIYYPQPFGFQAEWNVGRGPALNAAQTRVEERSLYGGYVMAMYRIQFETQELFPFVRWNYYRGGYKAERNAPYAKIDETELGLEWQINKALEVVGMYTFTDRTNTRAISTANQISYQQFEGSLLRLQIQFNY